MKKINLKLALITFLVIVFFQITTFGAFIRLTDGTEAQVKVIRLTDQMIVVQAVGFSDVVKLEPSDVEYVLLDESREDLKGRYGMILSNGSNVFAEKFDIDEKQATIQYNGVVTCPVKEVLYVSYKTYEITKREKKKLTTVTTSFEEIIRVSSYDGQVHIFKNFENINGMYVFNDGKITATFKPETVLKVSLPERYAKDYPSYLRLKTGEEMYCKVIGTTSDSLALETILKDKIVIKLDDISMINLDQYNENQRLKTLTITPLSNIIFTRPELGYLNLNLKKVEPLQINTLNIQPTLQITKIILRASPSFLKWKFQTGGPIWASPAISQDGTIYIGSYDKCLYAFAPEGKLKWKFTTDDWISSSPVISQDGTIYVGSDDGNLYAISPEGKLKWKFATNGCVRSSPTIGQDGTIYVGSYDKCLYAITPDGKLKWKFQTGGPIWASSTISQDGTIYVGSDDGNLYAISPEGRLKWNFGTGGYVRSNPVIGVDGTIYIGSNDDYLYAISPDGKLKWRFYYYYFGGYSKSSWDSYTNYNITSSPAIGPDGTIYVGSYGLYAITSDGKLKWRFQTGGWVGASPAIGRDGTIYVGSDDNCLYAITLDGELKWCYFGMSSGRNWDYGWAYFHAGYGVSLSPAIGPDGTVYVGSYDKYLYAIQTTSLGLADTPWPKFKGNLRNTGLYGEK